MNFINNKKELDKYAESYAAKTSSESLKSMAFKHVPSLLKKYDVNGKALDFGCGAGYSTKFLKSLGFDCIGVDINSKMIEIAKENDKSGIYESILDSKIPHKDKTFDLVFASMVFLEIDSMEKIKTSLMEISRVLKKDGHFVAVLDSSDTYKYNWSTLKTDFPQNKDLKSGKKMKVEFIEENFSIENYYWSQEDYLRVMKQANLELLEIFNLCIYREDTTKHEGKYVFPISVYFMKNAN